MYISRALVCVEAVFISYETILVKFKIRNTVSTRICNHEDEALYVAVGCTPHPVTPNLMRRTFRTFREHGHCTRRMYMNKCTHTCAHNCYR
jgi:hypothetical protein